MLGSAIIIVVDVVRLRDDHRASGSGDAEWNRGYRAYGRGAR